MSANKIRVATEQDAETLVKIYAPYVEKTAISFEYVVPSVEEFKGRMRHVLEKYPYLVAERDGEIVGYAYVGPFGVRSAYDWVVETSIYVREDQKKTGVGKELYQAIENILKEQRIVNLYACIAYPSEEDEHLTRNSVQFHEHMGYRLVGEFYRCGYKFGRWYNMVWMEKMIGDHVIDEQPAVKIFDEVRSVVAEKFGIV